MATEFELIQHTGDIKLRVYGANLEELFRNALKGMFASIKPTSPEITYKNDTPIVHKFTVEHEVTVHSPERELLLVDFLSECLYLSDVHNEAYFDVRYKVFTDTELQAYIYGVAITGFEAIEIKAVTYHDIYLDCYNGLCEATIVFDI